MDVFQPELIYRNRLRLSGEGFDWSRLRNFGTANRRFFHGPGINNFDMGITKRIPVTEAKAFEIRGEFFNIFNHAQFVNPSGDIEQFEFWSGHRRSRPAHRAGQREVHLVIWSNACKASACASTNSSDVRAVGSLLAVLYHARLWR